MSNQAVYERYTHLINVMAQLAFCLRGMQISTDPSFKKAQAAAAHLCMAKKALKQFPVGQKIASLELAEHVLSECLKLTIAALRGSYIQNVVAHEAELAKVNVRMAAAIADKG